MKAITLPLAFAAALGIGPPAHSAVFDLRDAAVEALDGAASLVLVQPDVTVTLSTADGVLNRTASGFGINAPTGGDDADGIDGGVVDERLRFVFDTNVRLDGLVLSRLGGSDVARLRYGAAVQLIESSGLHVPAFGVVQAGDMLVLEHVAGNGFSLDALRATPASAAVVLGAPASVLAGVPLAWLALARGRHGRRSGDAASPARGSRAPSGDLREHSPHARANQRGGLAGAPAVGLRTLAVGQ